MNQPLQSIIQHLFQVNSLDDVSRQRLEYFVEEYPSFGIGHYLLSQKLRTEDPDRFQVATQRTGLYFSNPLWLQWLLENSAIQHGQDAFVSAKSRALEEPPVEPPEATIEQSGREMPEEATNDSYPDTPDKAVEEDSEPEKVSAADQLLLSIEQAKGLRESLQKMNEEFQTGPVEQAAPVRHDESVHDESVHEKPIHDEPIHDEETAFVLDEPEEPAPLVAPESHTPAPIPAPPASTPPPDKDLVFEPYHTIDYFASQGIRLKLEENPGDALGKQLKSFTDWLKVMRRLPQKERESSVPDRIAEQAVQHFAAHSIQSKDIVTETMAEVLIMQGMRDRARAIYEKLSLLNPDKKAYFAAKIEKLNIP